MCIHMHIETHSEKCLLFWDQVFFSLVFNSSFIFQFFERFTFYFKQNIHFVIWLLVMWLLFNNTYLHEICGKNLSPETSINISILQITKVSEICICYILSPEEKIENFDT